MQIQGTGSICHYANNNGEKDDFYDMLVVNSTIPTGYTAYIIPTEISIDDGDSGIKPLFSLRLLTELLVRPGRLSSSN